jgi:hypothetical protein
MEELLSGISGDWMVFKVHNYSDTCKVKEEEDWLPDECGFGVFEQALKTSISLKKCARILKLKIHMAQPQTSVRV